MMPCNYNSDSGKTIGFDLDSVFDVASAYSNHRSGWTATLIYIPETGTLVELRSSPQDIRGNSSEEAQEVSDAYAQDTFGLTLDDLQGIRKNPGGWQFVGRRVKS
jgi:hypothetical protein